MKILMMCRLFSPHIGGVEKHVEQIAIQASAEGHDMSIITSTTDHSLPSCEKNENYTVYRIFLPKNTQTYTGKIVERCIIYSWVLSHFSQFLSSDIIHIHDVFFWYWPIRFLLPWKKVYITFHGFEPHSVMFHMTSKGQGKLFIQPKAIRARALAEKYTHGNICVGKWIQQWYGTRPTFVTYGGADCQVSKRSHRSGAVFIGRIAPDTGIQGYIKAMNLLPTMKLEVLGEGKIDNGPKNVKMKGITSSPCSEYPKYEYAFVSSYLSMLEAMQCKTLVVALAVHQLKYDYLMSHPMYANIIIARSAEEMVKKVSSLTAAKKQVMVNRCFAWAQQQTWKQVYTSTYKQLWQI